MTIFKSKFDNFSLVVTVILVLFIVLPLILMTLFAFSSKISAIPTSFTIKWITMRLNLTFQAMKITLSIAIPALILAFLISLPLSYAIAKRNFWGKNILDQLVIIPILIPGTVYGLALLQLFNSSVFRSIPPLVVLILAHTMVIIPVISRPIIASLQQLNKNCEEAAYSLGSKPIKTFAKIIFPLISPGVLIGIIFGFARSANDFIMTLYLVSSDTVPLSIYIFNSTHYSIPQLTAATAIPLLILSFIVIYIAEKFTEAKYIV
jgi:ABC-type spermidine/putrescine transport system permease subunit II